MNTCTSENTFTTVEPMVSIAVCTRRRPELIRLCLESLIRQETDFPFEIVCVENDDQPFICDVIADLIDAARQRNIVLKYFHQPVQNIGLTRNCCIAHSSGRFLAFIDDDETAESSWLTALVTAQQLVNADVVTGTVIYDFPDGFPEYLKRSRVYRLFDDSSLLDDSSFSNNPAIPVRQNGADANTTLYRRELFQMRTPSFNPDFGRTGGGDYEFALYILNRGKTIYRTSSARVHELQPASRARVKFHLERQFREPGNTYRALRMHAGRKESLKFLLRRTAEALGTIASECFLMWKHPRQSLVDIAGRFACLAGIVAAVCGFRKQGYR